MTRPARNGAAALLGLTCLSLWGCGAEPASVGPQPYGLEQLVYNTSCQIETVNDDGTVSIAPTLADTGCYADLAAKKPIDSLVPFDINVSLWSDGATKRRYFALPPGTRVGFTETGAWEFPKGTVLMKEFILAREAGNPDSRFVMETRFFVSRTGTWRGYSYEWNESGTDGALLANKKIGAYEVQGPEGPRTHRHLFPSRQQCLRCHPKDAGTVLGLHTPQMNRTHTYPNATDNQLRTLEHIDVFTAELSKMPEELGVLPNPEDPGLDLETRARSLLHADCAHCHQPQGSAVSSNLDLRFDSPLVDTAICAYVEPGNPAASSLWQEMESGDMPPIASELLDPRAEIVKDWIASMTSCP